MVALKSDTAAEKSKDQLSRDFYGSFDFRLLQQYLPTPDLTQILLAHGLPIVPFNCARKVPGMIELRLGSSDNRPMSSRSQALSCSFVGARHACGSRRTRLGDGA